MLALESVDRLLQRNPSTNSVDVGGERTAAVLSTIATCIEHDVNPRAYLHLVTRLVVGGWPQRQLRELLPERIVVAHPELATGEPAALLPSGD